MGKKSLPNGFWTDFDGLLEIYKQDFEDAKKMDKTTNEIDFINVHVLPQFEKHLKEDGGFPMQKLADKKMVDYLKSRVLELQEIESNRIYFFKDGKRKMSGYDWIQEIEKARGEKSIGDIILPTHNFEMLKAHRLKNVFEPEKAKLIEENKINKIGTDEIDVRLLYIQFLNDELKAIDNWIERINKLSTKVLYKAEIIQIEKYRLFINDEISKPEIANSLRSSEKKKSITYKWLNSPDTELPELFKKMRGKFISKITTPKQFKDVFTGQPIEKVTPVKWHENNASELLYFISQLAEMDIVVKKKRMDYKQMIACFVKPSGKPFTENFKELKQKIKINLNEDKQRAIDELINDFR